MDYVEQLTFLMNTTIFIFFFAPLQPILFIIGLIGNFCYYKIIEYVLFNRYKLAIRSMSRRVIIAASFWYLLALAIGNLFFMNFTFPG